MAGTAQVYCRHYRQTGDRFRPVLKAAWLVYIQEVYQVEGGQVLEALMSESVVVAEDD